MLSSQSIYRKPLKRAYGLWRKRQRTVSFTAVPTSLKLAMSKTAVNCSRSVPTLVHTTKTIICHTLCTTSTLPPMLNSVNVSRSIAEWNVNYSRHNSPLGLRESDYRRPTDLHKTKPILRLGFSRPQSRQNLRYIPEPL